jgi:hypothetical protein
MMPNKPNWKQTVKEHIVGPTGSVILHIFIVVALLKYVQNAQKEEAETVMVKVIENKEITVEEIKLEPIELDDLTEVDEMVTDPTDFTVEAPTADAPTPTPSTQTADLTDLAVMSDISSPVVMSGIMAGRNKGGREAGLGRFGGSRSTERAVIRALEWLRKNQNKDGSWGNGDQSAYAGLGLLTFLAHGETPASERYGPTVERAITYLLGAMDDKGRFKNAGGHYVYGHALAAYGLSEAYGMTRIPLLKPAMEKCIQVIIDGQQRGGGWDYDYKADSTRNDSSVSAWQVQALKAAKIAGAGNPKLDEALRRSLEGMRQNFRADTGRFTYTPGSRSNDGLTALGALCFQLNGQSNSQVVSAALGALKDAEPGIVINRGDDPDRWPYYAAYYITQAKFHGGNAHFGSWNKKVMPEFLKTQNEDGSWSPPAPEARNGELSTKTYGTTFAALSLQVYYRFLPSYQETAVAPAAAEAQAEAPKADDIEIDLNI